MDIKKNVLTFLQEKKFNNKWKTLITRVGLQLKQKDSGFKLSIQLNQGNLYSGKGMVP